MIILNALRSGCKEFKRKHLHQIEAIKVNKIMSKLNPIPKLEVQVLSWA